MCPVLCDLQLWTDYGKLPITTTFLCNITCPQIRSLYINIEMYNEVELDEGELSGLSELLQQSSFRTLQDLTINFDHAWFYHESSDEIAAFI